MNQLPYIPPLRPEPERNRWGQYVLPDANGKKRGWARATTLAHAISDEYYLTLWKRRMVLQGLAVQPGLLENVAEMAAELEHPDPEARKAAKDVLNGICDDAATAGGAGEGAKLGTLLHLITEYADFGRLAEIDHLIPDELRPDLDAYLATLDRLGIERPHAGIERIVVNSTVDSAGTLDRLVRVNGGPLTIGDLKTQKTIDFGFLEIAIQLAEYAYAESMWDEDRGVLVPMPAVDQRTALVFHLPVGSATCTVYEVDLEAGWRAAQLAHEVRETRKQSKAMGRPWRPPVAAQAAVGGDDHVLYLIRAAGHPDALVGIWRGHVQKGLPWTAQLNSAAALRKAQLTAATAATPATAAA
jgi:hypothetical protein